MTDIKDSENQQITAFVQEKMNAMFKHYEQRLLELQTELDETKQQVCYLHTELDETKQKVCYLQDTLEMHGNFILIGWCSRSRWTMENSVPIIINAESNISLRTIDSILTLIPVGYEFDEDSNDRRSTVVELNLSQLYKTSVRNIDIASLMCNYNCDQNSLMLTLMDDELDITLHSVDCQFFHHESTCEMYDYLSQNKETIEIIENKYPGLFAPSSRCVGHDDDDDTMHDDDGTMHDDDVNDKEHDNNILWE